LDGHIIQDWRFWKIFMDDYGKANLFNFDLQQGAEYAMGNSYQHNITTK
jgi:hypothetical protein